MRVAGGGRLYILTDPSANLTTLNLTNLTRQRLRRRLHTTFHHG